MLILFSFFFNDTATTEIYTLSLHDALPISRPGVDGRAHHRHERGRGGAVPGPLRDRKSTRLNSSHVAISYAVFCLKKKKAPDGPSRTARIGCAPLASSRRIPTQPHRQVADR